VSKDSRVNKLYNTTGCKAHLGNLKKSQLFIKFPFISLKNVKFPARINSFFFFRLKYSLCCFSDSADGAAALLPTPLASNSYASEYNDSINGTYFCRIDAVRLMKVLTASTVSTDTDTASGVTSIFMRRGWISLQKLRTLKNLQLVIDFPSIFLNISTLVKKRKSFLLLLLLLLLFKVFILLPPWTALPGTGAPLDPHPPQLRARTSSSKYRTITCMCI
jgi:hypothetical protein